MTWVWPGPLRVSEVQGRNTCYKGGFFSEDSLLSSSPMSFYLLASRKLREHTMEKLSPCKLYLRQRRLKYSTFSINPTFHAKYHGLAFIIIKIPGWPLTLLQRIHEEVILVFQFIFLIFHFLFFFKQLKTNITVSFDLLTQRFEQFAH